MTRPIRLVVFDIDGVLSAGEAQPLDLALLADLAAMNRAARRDPRRPAVTVCTGRPAPYAEVIVQTIDGHLPAVYENGCGLYLPEGYRFEAHPRVAGGSRAFAQARERLRADLVATGQAFFQPGKEHSLSLFPLGSLAAEDLQPLAEAALGGDGAAVSLVYSISCLNVVPRGVDKGLGVAYLCERAGYALEEVLGVGDSDVDLQFLAEVGYSAAPSNANEAVQQLVNYVSPYPTTQGVRDILSYFSLAASAPDPTAGLATP